MTAWLDPLGRLATAQARADARDHLGSVWTFNMFNVVYRCQTAAPWAARRSISDAYQWAFSGGNYYGYAAAYAVLIFGVLVYSRFANRVAGRRVL